MNKELKQKYDRLKDVIKAYGSVAVAFSGGVDSTFLLKAACDAVGTDNVIAITAKSESFPARERNEAKSFCSRHNIKHAEFEAKSMELEGFKENPVNRCYICKKQIFSTIVELAKKNGIKEVIEGTNMDDNGDFRPGLQAIEELNVKSPLREAELTKHDIREISKCLGLSSWDKQSFACLATRFPYGEQIDDKKLNMVDKAEQFLLDLGFWQVRVRVHGGTMARIEVPDKEIPRIMECREGIYQAFTSYGFTYISLDLKGYRTGSMNEVLDQE